MAKKIILLIEDNPKAEASIKEALGKEYNLQTVRARGEAVSYLEKKSPDLILIDFDLKAQDGLQIYRELRPHQKVIMLSASGNVPLAVTATKQGVVEFLRKPINAEELLSAVERNIFEYEGRLRWRPEWQWLKGESPKIKEMLRKIGAVIKRDEDFVLLGEEGVPKEEVAEFVHCNSPQQDRKRVSFDLSSFAKKNLEAHFWANLKRVLAPAEASSLQRASDLCGTLYLDNLERIDEHFRITLFNYFKESKKDVRVIFGVKDKSLKVKDYPLVEVPPLRERRGDMPNLLGFYLKRASAKFNKAVKHVSTEILSFLASYDFPGNYVELGKMIEDAVLTATTNNLEGKNFPFDYRGLIHTCLEGTLAENLPLDEAKRRFERKLYRVILEKVGQDQAAAARFLDVPKSVLAARLENLLD
jgi:DNA-binding NtrC family response regulator